MQFTLAIFFHLFFPSFGPHNIVTNRYSPPLSDTIHKRQMIVVRIDAKNKIFIGSEKDSIPMAKLDSVLKSRVDANRMNSDTAIVVMNADVNSLYGKVFQVMQSAKRAGAKVVANVN